MQFHPPAGSFVGFSCHMNLVGRSGLLCRDWGRSITRHNQNSPSTLLLHYRRRCWSSKCPCFITRYVVLAKERCPRSSNIPRFILFYLGLWSFTKYVLLFKTQELGIHFCWPLLLPPALAPRSQLFSPILGILGRHTPWVPTTPSGRR